MTHRRSAYAVVAIACMALAGISGCKGGASIALDGELPTPLVVSAPVRVGLVLEPALIEYVHEETLDRGGPWRVDIGAMQPKLFTTVFDALFDEVTPIGNVADGGGFDGVIAPVIDKMQIAVPAQTQSEFYEVWIRYLVRLYAPTGELIVAWPLTAYGKASKDEYGFMTNPDAPGMQAATMTAMRDAAAFLALRFTADPKVQRWLMGHERSDVQ